jgi:hypothetical protein
MQALLIAFNEMAESVVFILSSPPTNLNLVK